MTPNTRQSEDEDDLRLLASLFGRNTPAEPDDIAWAKTLDRIADATRPPRRPWWPILGPIAALILFGVGYAMWPAPRPQTSPVAVLPPGDDNEEPWAVARASEVFVISVDVEDADRLALGLPLMGSFDVANPGDIILEKAEPNPDDEDTTPWLHPGEKVPLIVASAKEP